MHLLYLGDDLFMHFIINTYDSPEISLSASHSTSHVFYGVGPTQRRYVGLNNLPVATATSSVAIFPHSNPYLKLRLNHPSKTPIVITQTFIFH